MFLCAASITTTEGWGLINKGGTGTLQTKTHNNHYRIYIRILLCLALVFLFLIAMTGFAAAETKTGTVATTALNLRSGPGSSYTSLGLLSINKVYSMRKRLLLYSVTTTQILRTP